MDSQRWRQIEDLYNAAQECEPRQRASLLNRADPEIRREVEQLLAQEGSLLDQPAWQGCAEETVTIVAAGRRLGRFEIEGRLGAGGMGEVFRARDTRLNRSVALKISKIQFSERFEREARAIAALNHPNICTLHDVGPNYLVMELLEGSTLSEEIRKGPIAPETATQYGAQIAAALSEAHRQGIVHRDLKPGNVMLTRHGVKVLDFGLAKLPSPSALTQTNAVMGTPAYMAPEQWQSGPADARTDLFALGLMLYEMVRGKAPIPGASPGQMMAGGAPLSIEPPCKTRSKLASRLNTLILGLLERDPSRRPQDAAAVRKELMNLGALGERQTLRHRTTFAVAAIVLLLAVAGLWWFYRLTARVWPEVSRISLITTSAGTEAMPAASADGEWVAFSWTGGQGTHRNIWVTRTDGLGQARRLTYDGSPDTADAFPAWSPDGRQIAFVRRSGASGGNIIVIPAAGGEEHNLQPVRLLSFPAASWLAWTPDGGRIIFASASLESGRSTLYVLRLSDGSVRALRSPPDSVIGDASPTVSPDGNWLGYVRWSSPEVSTLMVQRLGKDEALAGDATKISTEISTVVAPQWADNHRLFFLGRQRIMEWEAGAAPRQIYVSASRLMGLTVAGRDSNGTPRLVTAQTSAASDQVWVIPLRRAGVAAGSPVLFSQLGNGSRNPDFSPDGKKLVFVSERTGYPELWVADSSGGGLRQLTRMGLKNLGIPRWSPDNRQVAFMARTDMWPQIYVVDTMQARPVPRQVTHDAPGCNVPTWSDDGKFIFCSRKVESETRLFRAPVGDSGAGEAEIERWFPGKEAKETPDGRMLYFKNEQWGLFARSTAGNPNDNPEERLVDDMKGPIAYYAPVKEGVYYTGQDSFGNYARFRFFAYATRRTIDVASKELTGGDNSLTVSPDGRRLLYTRKPVAGADLTLIQF